MSESSKSRTREARLVADIGAAIAGQDLRVRVTLPQDLAHRAVEAWRRDDLDPADGESTAERTERERAGHAALIGLAVTERGVTLPDGTIGVDVDAWSIGAALDAADDLGLLDEPPSSA